MKREFFKKGLISAAAMAFATFSVSAHAGEAHGLKSWAKGAGASVNQVMTYPRMALRNGDQGFTSLRITVNRDGDVVASSLLQGADSALINAAARNVVKRADFPALPSNFGGEKLTFSLHLNYAIADSFKEEQALMREGRVTGREIAEARGPMSASIVIEADQGE